MAVNLSPFGGVGVQFFDNSGNPLTGGKIFTYTAGTTTPQTTYTTSAGTTPHTNPIILDAGGRVPSGGEIWLTDGLQYKFLLKDANDVQIASYDNVIGINSNFVNYTNSQEIQTATAGQTVFNLTTVQYQPGTNSLSVFVDGVNQYGPGAQYAYVETDSTTVTFVSGLHIGASVKFTTSQLNTSAGQTAAQTSFTGFKGQIGNVQDLADADGSDWIGFESDGVNAVARSAQDKMRDIVSVKDFGAVGDGVADDTTAIQNAIDYAISIGTGTENIPTVFFPVGVYKTSNSIDVTGYVSLLGDGATSSVIKPTVALVTPCLRYGVSGTGLKPAYGLTVQKLGFDGSNTTNPTAHGISMYCAHTEFRDNSVANFSGHGIYAYQAWSNSLHHNFIDNNALTGLYIAQECNAFNISWNYVLRSGNHGIFLTGVKDVVVHGNDIEQSNYNGIRILGSPSPAQATRSVTITSNYFELNGVDPSYTDAIYADKNTAELSYLEISNNYGPGQVIYINGITSAVVKNNAQGLTLGTEGYNVATYNQSVVFASTVANNKYAAYLSNSDADGLLIEGRLTGLAVRSTNISTVTDLFIVKNDGNNPRANASLAGSLSFTPIAAANAQNNSIYVSSVDGKLYFKDSGGTSHALY